MLYRFSLAKRLENKRGGKDYLNSLQTGHIDSGFVGKNKPCLWFTSMKEMQEYFRFTGYSHDIIHLRHTGYYTDSFQDGIARGIVVQIPGRSHEPQYLHGFECTNEDTVCILRDSITDEKNDAAIWADREAELYAEDSREGDAQSSAEMQIDNKKEEIAAAFAEIKRVRAELHSLCEWHCVAREKLRDSLRDSIEEIKSARKRIKDLEENYWLSVE